MPPPGRGLTPRPVDPAVSYPPTQGCTALLGYCGGPIVESPQVVQVSWNDPGANGAVASSVESYLQAWWPAILSPQAGYLGWLTEYDTVGLTGKDGLPGSNQTFAGFGTYVGLYSITPSAPNQGAQLDDSAIRAELVAQITAGHLPQPTCDASGRCDTLYMIDLPPSVTTATVTLGGATEQLCASLCGYHLGTTFAGKTIGYAVFPDPTMACPGCAHDGLEQDLGALHSHELAEAITDPDSFLENLTSTSTDCMRPGAWDQRASGCGEIGDSCAWPAVVPAITVFGQAFYVQGLFDNARRDCETSGPTQPCTSSAGCAPPIPVCDPNGHTCRACLPGDCSGSTPACATSGPHAGTCVACATDSDCAQLLNAPICDATSNTCRPCVSSDCVALTPVCATAGHYAGRCVECASNADCSAPSSVCSPETYTCGACVAGLDCPEVPPASVCGPPSYACATNEAAAGDGGSGGAEGGKPPRDAGPTSSASATGSGCETGAGGGSGLAGVLVGSVLLGAIRRRRAYGR